MYCISNSMSTLILTTILYLWSLSVQSLLVDLQSRLWLFLTTFNIDIWIQIGIWEMSKSHYSDDHHQPHNFNTSPFLAYFRKFHLKLSKCWRIVQGKLLSIDSEFTNKQVEWDRPIQKSFVYCMWFGKPKHIL